MRLAAATLALTVAAAAPAAASSMPAIDLPPERRGAIAAGVWGLSADWQVAPGLIVGGTCFMPLLGPPRPTEPPKPSTGPPPAPVLGGGYDGPSWGAPAPQLGPRIAWRWLRQTEDDGREVDVALEAAGGPSFSNAGRDWWAHAGIMVASRQGPFAFKVSIGPSWWLVRDPAGGLAYDAYWLPLLPAVEAAWLLPGDYMELTLGGNALLGLRVRI